MYTPVTTSHTLLNMNWMKACGTYCIKFRIRYVIQFLIFLTTALQCHLCSMHCPAWSVGRPTFWCIKPRFVLCLHSECRRRIAGDVPYIAMTLIIITKFSTLQYYLKSSSCAIKASSFVTWLLLYVCSTKELYTYTLDCPPWDVLAFNISVVD
jgi:hypothetical protein